MNETVAIKNAVLAAIAAGVSAVTGLMGGWDAALQTLLFLMAADCVSGVVVAGVFKCSGKSKQGRLDSRAGFKGLCKKGAELLLVLVAVRLDALVGAGQYTRMAVIFFFIGNEGLSILENMGLMGVPYPRFLKNALEALQDKGNKGEINSERVDCRPQ